MLQRYDITPCKTPYVWQHKYIKIEHKRLHLHSNQHGTRPRLCSLFDSKTYPASSEAKRDLTININSWNTNRNDIFIPLEFSTTPFRYLSYTTIDVMQYMLYVFNMPYMSRHDISDDMFQAQLIYCRLYTISFFHFIFLMFSLLIKFLGTQITTTLRIHSL